MRILFFYLCSCLVVQFAIAQTWVQRLSHSAANVPFVNDSICGVNNICRSADGNIYFLGKLNQDDDIKAFKMSPAGGTFLWSLQVGWHFNLQVDQPVSLIATADLGCMVLVNHDSWASTGFTRCTITKYSAAGAPQWSKLFSNTSSTSGYKRGYCITQNSSGNYYALVEDSLFELNNSGNVIFSTNLVSGRQLFQLPSGEFVVMTHNNSLVRTDIAGNISWTYPGVNDSDIVSATSSSVLLYKRSLGQLKKIDVSNGSTLWTINISAQPVSSIDATADGGVIVAKGYPVYVQSFWPANLFPNPTPVTGALLKFDSTGSLQWNEIYNFPRYGLSSVKQTGNGYITGGTYMDCILTFSGCPGQYNGLVARIDSSGQGLLKITSNVWPREVDQNDTIDFAHDGLLTAMAIGATGLPRGDANFPCLSWGGGDVENDFAFDWQQSFCNGINYKYADYNGNGLIDTNDFVMWPLQFSPLSITCRLTSETSVNTLYDFSVVTSQTSAAPGDTMTFYLVAGGAANPIDSIYGLAAVLQFNHILTDPNYYDFQPYQSSLGTPGFDLIADFENYASIFNGMVGVLFCRNDHNNAFNVSDTLAKLRLRVYPFASTPATFNLNVGSYSALRLSGCQQIPMTYGGTSVSLQSVVTSLNAPDADLNIFPNPVYDEFIIENSKSIIEEAEIFNSIGKKIFHHKFTTDKNKVVVNASRFPSGIYFMKLKTAAGSIERKFVKQ
jgi:hypothetical protein